MSWTLSQLTELLAQHPDWVVNAENDCLCVTNEDGLDAYVVVSGAQILVEAILFGKNQVSDVTALNEEILKTHQVFPLTTIGITTIENEDYYMAFGALSSQSKAESVTIEIETLFGNVAGFLDAYENFIN